MQQSHTTLAFTSQHTPHNPVVTDISLSNVSKTWKEIRIKSHQKININRTNLKLPGTFTWWIDQHPRTSGATDEALARMRVERGLGEGFANFAGFRLCHYRHLVDAAGNSKSYNWKCWQRNSAVSTCGTANRLIGDWSIR